MKLSDSLQALEPSAERIREISEQGVNQLLKIITLICPHGHKVVEDFVVTLRVKLILECSHSLSLRTVEANGVADGIEFLRSRHGSTITQCTFQ